jgi:hypothetical protein
MLSSISIDQTNEHAADRVIRRVTAFGRTFRRGEGAKRPAGLTSAFGYNQKLVYSPLVRPVSVPGIKALIVGHELAMLEPRFFGFFSNLAHDNSPRTDRVDNPLAAPEAPREPDTTLRAKPQEPVRPSHGRTHAQVAVHNRRPWKRSGRPAGRPDRADGCAIR